MNLDTAVITDTMAVASLLVEHVKEIPLAPLHLRKNVFVPDARKGKKGIILYQKNIQKLSVKKGGVQD